MSKRNSETSLASSADVVVVGAGLGGLSAALWLATKGIKPLLLERHHVPGGFATSFVRGRFEFEASLHELSDVGPPDNKGNVRQFLEDEAGVNLDWVRVPEAYRLILSDEDMNVRVPFGMKAFIDTVEEAVPGCRKPLTRYMDLCQDIYDVFMYLGNFETQLDLGDIKKVGTDILALAKKGFGSVPAAANIEKKVRNLLSTAGYTVDQVTATFGIPDRALKILYPYWCYMGIPTSRMNFPIWAAMIVSYLTLGAYLPRHRSQELSYAMEARMRELGGRIEYNTPVRNILVEKGRVVGVETAQGDRIDTSHVICNASPTLTFKRLIHPAQAVPATGMQWVNARRVARSGFVVFLGLDASARDLGLTDYGYFVANDMNTDELYEETGKLSPGKMQATICLNNAVPDCSPPGTSILSMTTLHGIDVWKDVRPEDYVKTKNRLAAEMIDQFERATNVRIDHHIEEIEVATPVTFARYTGAQGGGIYGYEQDPWDSVLLRGMFMKQEKFIGGLEFAGGHAFMGHGFSPSILSGRMAAQETFQTL